MVCLWCVHREEAQLQSIASAALLSMTQIVQNIVTLVEFHRFACDFGYLSLSLSLQYIWLGTSPISRLTHIHSCSFVARACRNHSINKFKKGHPQMVFAAARLYPTPFPEEFHSITSFIPIPPFFYRCSRLLPPRIVRAIEAQLYAECPSACPELPRKRQKKNHKRDDV